MNTIHKTTVNQGEHLLVVTDVLTIKATGQETGEQMLVVEGRVPPGGGPPVLHRHTPAETFYILEGEFVFSMADSDRRLRVQTARVGDVVAIPPMLWHSYKNVGNVPGKYIAVLSPAGMEAFFREIGHPVSDPLNPPRPSGPPSEAQIQQMMAIIMKYMEILPPDQIVQ